MCKDMMNGILIEIHQTRSKCTLNRKGNIYNVFNFLLQVHFPFDPLQPGPIFFFDPEEVLRVRHEL